MHEEIPRAPAAAPGPGGRRLRAGRLHVGGGRAGRAGAAFPVTLDTPAGKLTLERQPSRIVSMSPTATEMLFAIGAGGQVAAVDSNSNYPKEAPTTDLSAYEPNLEAIAGYKPDLVVYSDDPGELAAGLGKLGIPAMAEPAATGLNGTYAQIDQLGRATGHEAEAAKVTT